MGAGIITNVGLEYIAKLINGIVTNYFDYLALGTGSTTESATDTALEAEVSAGGLARALATLSYEADYKAKFEKTWTYTGSGITIKEWGLFDAASSGNMAARQVISNQVLAINDTLTLTVRITTSRIT